MKAKVGSFLRKLTMITFLLGTASIILGILLSAAHLQASAAEKDSLSSGLQQQGGLCGDGEPKAVVNFTKAQTEYTYTLGLADHVYIKPDDGSCIFFNMDGTDAEGCYLVSGLLQKHNITVKELHVNPECKDIQRVEFYLSQAPSPTHTHTPLPSPTYTDTPTPTDTPVTPTTETPTNTPITPEPTTPTLTGTATDTPVTPSPTTPTSTGTTPTTTGSPTVSPSTTNPTFTSTATVRATVIPPVSTLTPTTRPPTLSPTAIPTVMPPAVATKQPQIIPVTGDDLESRIEAASLPQQMFLNFGAGLLGLALVLFGVSNKFKD